VVWVVDMNLLIRVLLVDLAVVLVDIPDTLLVEQDLVIPSQEIPQILLLQMVGDMMVVEVILPQFNKALVVVEQDKQDIRVNQDHQLMDMVVLVFNFQQHSVIPDLHRVEPVELDLMDQVLVVV
tara:strand:+ start:922 stop:1293 length:372 start_codon:yes stop_codon:yes gene_type:complete